MVREEGVAVVVERASSISAKDQCQQPQTRIVCRQNQVYAEQTLDIDSYKQTLDWEAKES